MFVVVSKQKRDRLNKAGYIHYKQISSTVWSDQTIHVPCVIFFVENDQNNWQHEMFKFELSLTHEIFIMSNLVKCEHSLHTMDESILHFFLEWIIIDAQKWAKTAMKKRIVIETTLPHCTEHFIEHGYSIRPFHILRNTASEGLSREYRGSKEL
jgi:hypothetical protein